MAKQSGLHQLRGKVGEHSYYKQTGVASGLVRSINQGMSARVKTSDEYANVRLNNAEFGQAGRIAKVIGQMITPKYRPMILPFSQSKMAKVILEAIKTNVAPWGERNLTKDNGVSVCINALNIVAKNDFDSYGLTLSNDGANFVVSASAQSVEKVKSMGANGAEVRIVKACPWIGVFSTDSQKYSDSHARSLLMDGVFVSDSDSVSTGLEFRPEPPKGWPSFQVNFIVVIVLPFRFVGDQRYTLQEYCTYRAFEVPSIPQP